MNPANKDLVAKFKAAGFNPEAYTLYSYTAVQALAAAAKSAGSLEPDAIATALREKGPFTSVLGDISFDEKGDPKLPGYIVYEWKKGADGKYSYFPLAD